MNPMFDAMNAVAASSWNLMEAGISHGIGPGEEALTDVNLIRLRQLIPSLRVKKFSKSEESGNGADWEWWIGSSREKRWIKVRVQAKRSSHERKQYEQLGHEVKLRNSAGDVVRDSQGEAVTIMQYDALITRSLADGAIPLHVFFNGWPEDRFKVGKRYYDAIARHRRAARDGVLPSSAWDSRNWGCTIASAAAVKIIYEDPTVSDFPGSYLDAKLRKDRRYVPFYLSHSTPWSHLFCSRDVGRAPTVREIAENLHLMQGNDGELSDEEFAAMTYPNPSYDAQVAVLGRIPFRGANEHFRHYESGAAWGLAAEFLSSLDIPADYLPRLLDIVLSEQAGYGLFLDLAQAYGELDQ